jgi:hypothetical protein
MLKRTVAIIVFALFASGLAAQTSEKSWNFDADPPGGIPEGFTVMLGDWKIVVDPNAPSRPGVLAQLAKNSGSLFNLILVSGTNSKNVDISVKMKAVAGKEDQGGGLVWRARDSSNYYVARYNPLEDNYRVYRVEQSRRVQLQNADIKHSDGWHTLRATMEGDHIQCYYDGTKYLDVNDSTFQTAGKIGLWTKADAQSHFDDLTMAPNKGW